MRQPTGWAGTVRVGGDSGPSRRSLASRGWLRGRGLWPALGPGGQRTEAARRLEADADDSSAD